MKYSLKRPRQSNSIDGVWRNERKERLETPTLPTPTPQQNPIAQPQATRQRTTSPTPPTVQRTGFRLPQWAQLILAFPVMLVIAFSIQSAALGQLLIVIYGVVAFVRQIPSRTTFAMALVSMIATIILLVVRGNLTLAQNFATYTFLFLVVGVFTLSRELKKEGGRIYNSRYNRQQ